MKVWRGFNLLINQELLQGGFLLGPPFENEQHAVHWQALGRAAVIPLWPCQRMNISTQSDKVPWVYRLRYPQSNLRRLGSHFDHWVKNQTNDQCRLHNR